MGKGSKRKWSPSRTVSFPGPGAWTGVCEIGGAEEGMVGVLVTSRRQTINKPNTPHVARREAALGLEHDDPQLDQSAKLIRADARRLGGLG
jgi:hypothetical protein